jgi:hypothetical protein
MVQHMLEHSLISMGHFLGLVASPAFPSEPLQALPMLLACSVVHNDVYVLGPAEMPVHEGWLIHILRG